MMSRPICVAVLTAAILAVSVDALAQAITPRPRTGRPTRALFGSGVGDNGQELFANFSFAQGYDDGIQGTGDGSADPFPAISRQGMFTSGGGSLAYNLNSERVTVQFAGSGFARYYPTYEDPLVATYSVHGMLSYRASDKLSFSTAHRVALEPFGVWPTYGVRPPDDGPDQIPPDLLLASDQPTYSALDSSAGVSYDATSRLKLMGGYRYYKNNLTFIEGINDYSASHVNAGVTYSIAKGLGARVGYGAGISVAEDDSVEGSSTDYSSRTIDGGIDFNRAISISRRTLLNFSIGFTGLTDLEDVVHYFATGFVTISHEIGRSWTIGAGYIRSATLFSAFGQPTTTHTAEFRVSGLLNNRTTVGASVQVGNGAVGVAAAAPGYFSGSASAGLRLAINRYLGMSAHYAYLRYEFDEGIALQPGFSSNDRRHSARVAVDFFLPLMTKQRRQNASR